MVDPDTSGLLVIIGIGILVGSIVLLVFGFVRKKFPQVYQFRRLINRYGSYNDFNGKRVGFPSTRPRPGFFGWLGPALSTPEDEIVARIGLDGAMYIRFLRSMLTAFAIVTTVCVVILWPVYGTAANKDLPSSDPNFQDGLQVLSLANVPVGDNRLWATLVCEFVVAAVFLYFLYRDYSQYAEYRRNFRTLDNPANYSLIVYDIPDGSNSVEGVREWFELMVPGQVSEVVLARKTRAGSKAEKLLNSIVLKKEAAEVVRSTTDTEPMTRPGTCGMLMCWKAKVNAVEYYTAEKERLEQIILDEGRESPNGNAAVVVFTNKRAASLIAQANQGGNANEWIIERAGEPEGMNWGAMKIPGYQAAWRAIAVIGFVFFLTFFWIVPAAFIAGLANLESLSEIEAFSFLDRIQELSPGVVGLIENALPSIILAVILGLIPTFIRIAVSHTRLHNHQLIEAKTRNYFYVFTIFASFVFVVLGDAALNRLSDVLDDPGLLTQLLANSVPSNGLFFTSFVVISTFIPLALQLLNPGRLVVRWLLLKLSKTERQRRKAEASGSVFPYFKMYGMAMMMALIGLAYTTLAPLVAVAVTVFFAVSFAVSKHNVLYATYRAWDGAGWDYPGAFWGVVAGLLVKQLTMVGVIGLFEAPGPAVIALIPLITTILFSVWCNRRYSRVSLHGTLHDQYTHSSKIDEIPSRYAGLYRQPGVSLKPYVNLSGMEVPTDVYDAEDGDVHDAEYNAEGEFVDARDPEKISAA